MAAMVVCRYLLIALRRSWSLTGAEDVVVVAVEEDGLTAGRAADEEVGLTAL
jgi:hypothetical protein